MKRIGEVVLGFVVAIAVAGCATTGVDRNYAAALEAHHATEQARYQVEIERARTEQARFKAMQDIASSGDATTKTMALFALATGGQGGAIQLPVGAPSALPAMPESSSDKALKWAQILLPTATSIANGLFQYRMGVAQSDNARDVTIASYGAFSNMASSGLTAAQAIATLGFGNSATIAGFIQTPQPNITLSGTGVIGAGSYVGPNAGQNSGNAGTIGNENASPKPVTTTTTTTTNANRTCSGGSSGTTGAAGSGSC